MKNEESDGFFEVAHRHDRPVASLITYFLTSIIYATMQLAKKRPFISCSTANHSKPMKFSITNFWDNLVKLFVTTKLDFTFGSTITAYLGSFAKVSTPILSIIPWLNRHGVQGIVFLLCHVVWSCHVMQGVISQFMLCFVLRYHNIQEVVPPLCYILYHVANIYKELSFLFLHCHILLLWRRASDRYRIC